jgi:hypothetical protein
MALRHVDRLLPWHHAEEADEGDHRRRRRADLDKAVRGAHRQPHEERDEIPKHRHLPLFLRPQYDPARRAGRDLAISFLRLAKAAGLQYLINPQLFS